MRPEVLARVHAAAFATDRPWSEDEFRRLLDSAHVFAVGDARAFALGRCLAGEAEILTLATDPAHRRAGLARACLASLEDAAHARGARVVFLEVAADNAAARALYAGADYLEAGRRKGYYGRGEAGRADALILRKALTPPA